MYRLDDLLKRAGLAQTGGHAKLMIQAGEVKVNGEVETRRRRQLCAGDHVTLIINGEEIGIEVTPD
ncbi:MAG: RNA-binding S4 domain-containing protein [Planctomycetota bacterium]